MANEALTGITWLEALLTADATLMALVSGVFRNVAPAGTAPDWVIIGHQSDTDTLTATAVRILTANQYRVFAVGPESHFSNLQAICDRVDALLQPGGTPLRNTTAGGVTIKACFREQAIALPEEVPGSASGPAWLNAGGLYRLVA